MRYVVFDTETPNSRNDRMCQIGVCVVDGGKIVSRLTRLVDPECGYSPYNIMIHGITPEDTYQEPCFASLWDSELSELFSSGVPAAHNAPFDMAVLAKCLRAYGIEWRRRVGYIDTVRMARRAFPSLPNHRLDTLSDALGIALDHHDAGSDAEACARVLLACEARGVNAGDFIREYDLVSASTVKGAAGHV